jgi:hypothetical protein
MKKFLLKYKFWWILFISWNIVYFNRNDLVYIIAFIGALVVYLYWATSKTLEGRKQSPSHWFNVDVKESVLLHKKFKDITGLERYKNWNEYEKLPKHEKEKWEKIWKELEKAYVSVNYLSSENAYYINNNVDNPYFVLREDNLHLLYSAILLGDKSGFKSNIEFLLYERFENGKWLLVPCLQYSDDSKNYFDKDRKSFDILFEFPLFDNLSTEKAKELGFEYKKTGGDDVYTDHFGKMHGVPTEVKYIKNGAIIRYVY